MRKLISCITAASFLVAAQGPASQALARTIIAPTSQAVSPVPGLPVNLAAPAGIGSAGLANPLSGGIRLSLHGARE